MQPKSKRLPPPFPVDIVSDSMPMQDKIRLIKRWGVKITQCLADGLPNRHAFSHLGGTDSLASSSTPTSITLGEHDGDPGTLGNKYSLSDHEHPDTELAGLAGLGDISIDTTDGASVQDEKLIELLEIMAVQMYQIEELLGEVLG